MRTFGIEIEFVCTSYISLIQEFSKNNINILYVDDYKKSIKYSEWILVKETTVGLDGYELVSPILTLDNLKDIRTIFSILETSKFVSLNDKCGLHVHVDVSDHNLVNMINIIKEYWLREKEINKLLINPRHNNFYCVSSEKDIKRYESYRRLFKKDLTKFSRQEIEGFIFKHFPSKNRRVSLVTITSLNTIEFRQHEGTFDYLRVFKWIGFLLTLLENTLNTYHNQEIKINDSTREKN